MLQHRDRDAHIANLHIHARPRRVGAAGFKRSGAADHHHHRPGGRPAVVAAACALLVLVALTVVLGQPAWRDARVFRARLRGELSGAARAAAAGGASALAAFLRRGKRRDIVVPAPDASVDDMWTFDEAAARDGQAVAWPSPPPGGDVRSSTVAGTTAPALLPRSSGRRRRPYPSTQLPLQHPCPCRHTPRPAGTACARLERTPPTLRLSDRDAVPARGQVRALRRMRLRGLPAREPLRVRCDVRLPVFVGRGHARCDTPAVVAQSARARARADARRRRRRAAAQVRVPH